MRWNFEEIPLTVRLDEKTVFRTGMFSGSFEVDDIGMIQTIWLDEDAWSKTNNKLELKRWKPGQPAPGFKGRLFDALAATLEEKYEDEINEFLAELHNWPTRGEVERADRAWFRQGLL